MSYGELSIYVLLLRFGISHRYNIQENIGWLFFTVVHFVKRIVWYFSVLSKLSYYRDLFCLEPASRLRESPSSRMSALYWYYKNYGFSVCVISFSFYSIQLLSWLLLFGASIASSLLSSSCVSAIYRYYENYGYVYVIAAIVYWSTTILLFHYVLF